MTKVHDVCLLLEGSYPFVSGGVSTWVHNLIKSLPEISFTGYCILANSNEDYELKYELPENFTDFKTIYVHDPVEAKRNWLHKGLTRSEMGLIRDIHTRLRDRKKSDLEGVLDLFRSGRAEMYELVHGRKPWNMLVDRYDVDNNPESFLDYFWTYRFTHLPIFRMLMAEVPKARMYHTISTGYAGLMASVSSILEHRPMILTEHGIYTKERKIEIAQAEWIQTRELSRIRIERELGTFQKIWIRIFEGMGRICYEKADKIITLYGGNRDLEIKEGADPEKIEIVPNGINMDNFWDLKKTLPGEDDAPLTLGFVGRIVPIKDVKTFLRACKIASLQLPSLKVLILGPTDEDEEYFQECLELRDVLELKGTVDFLGKVNMVEFLPMLDCIVLTSISEAQPLVVMEANCAGIPAVCSDVGSCQELLEGRTNEDIALGPSGKITRVADPMGTAKAIIEVLSDNEKWKKMSEAGKKRVDMFYREEYLTKRYREIYTEYINKGDTE